MPPSPESFAERERLVKLEVQMGSLTEELSETKQAVRELTTALHELRGAFRGAMWVGGFVATGIGAIAWVGTWLFDKVWGAS